MAKVFIKRTRALQKIDQVKAHCKYVGFRSMEKSEHGFFGREKNYEDYKKFIKRIENNPALRHQNSIKAQKLIFSLKEQDYEAYKRSGKDYRDLIRSTLESYERKHNVKLDWIANIHEANSAESHPHVHVIIKGVSDEKDKDGKYTRIVFKKDDFKDMKSNFDMEFEKDAKYNWYEKIDFEKTINDISKGFERVIEDIKRDAEKEQMKGEYLRHKNIEKEIKDKDKGIGRDRERNR